MSLTMCQAPAKSHPSNPHPFFTLNKFLCSSMKTKNNRIIDFNCASVLNTHSTHLDAKDSTFVWFMSLPKCFDKLPWTNVNLKWHSQSLGSLCVELALSSHSTCQRANTIGSFRGQWWTSMQAGKGPQGCIFSFRSTALHGGYLPSLTKEGVKV